MTQKPDNPPAFPSGKDDYWREEGMTLRDYFAAAALQGLCACSAEIKGLRSHEEYATASYRIADAMLKARESRHDD